MPRREEITGRNGLLLVHRTVAKRLVFNRVRELLTSRGEVGSGSGRLVERASFNRPGGRL